MTGVNNGEFSFTSGTGEKTMSGRNGLAKITTTPVPLPPTSVDKTGQVVCHDDSAPTVKAQTIDELHSLQKKRSAPTTPIHGSSLSAQANFAASVSEEVRQKQQLQSIR